MLSCIRLLIVLWFSAKTRKINLMVHYVLCLLRSEAEIYLGAKRLVFHLSPPDGHVMIVSGCLILTAVNLIVLIRMAYITERLIKLCKIYCHVWHWLTWSVCTGGRAVVRYVITKFSWMDSLPNFVTHGAPRRARELSYNNALRKEVNDS